MKIENAVALVTGGASGIGLSISKMLVSNGAKVLLVDIASDFAGTKVVQDLNAMGPGQAKYYRSDMTDQKQLERAFEEPEHVFGTHAQIVINNAGLGVLDEDHAKVAKMVELNVGSVIHGTEFAAELMRKNGIKGCIINTASMSGLIPFYTARAYGATKWAVVGYTISCRRMLKTHGVRVNAICPGLVETPMLRTFESDLDAVNANTPLEKHMTADHVAKAYQAVILNDSLVANPIVVLPDKTFPFHFDFAKILLMVNNQDVPDLMAKF